MEHEIRFVCADYPIGGADLAETGLVICVLRFRVYFLVIADHRKAVGVQPSAQVLADEAVGAGDQDGCHVCCTFQERMRTAVPSSGRSMLRRPVAISNQSARRPMSVGCCRLPRAFGRGSDQRTRTSPSVASIIVPQTLPS